MTLTVKFASLSISYRVLLPQLSFTPKKAIRLNKSSQYLQASPKHLETVLIFQQHFGNQRTLWSSWGALFHGFLSTGPGHASQRWTNQSQDTGPPSLKRTRIQALSPLEIPLSPLQYEDCRLVSVMASYAVTHQIVQISVICQLLFTRTWTLTDQRHALPNYIYSLYSHHHYWLWSQGIYCSWWWI